MYTPTYSDLYTNAYLLHIYSDIHILRPSVEQPIFRSMTPPRPPDTRYLR